MFRKIPIPLDITLLNIDKLAVMFWPSLTHSFQEPSEPGTAQQILPTLHLELKILNLARRSV